jgi:hypothetical protein
MELKTKIRKAKEAANEQLKAREKEAAIQKRIH